MKRRKKIWIIAVVLMLLNMASCTMFEQYMKENSQTFMSLGIECMKADTFYAGFMAQFQKDPLNGGVVAAIGQTKLVAVFGCGGKLDTITCDLTKEPQEDPCYDVVHWNNGVNMEKMRESLNSTPEELKNTLFVRYNMEN